MKLQLPSSSSDNGRWRDGGQLGVVRTKNAQRKRLQIRRLSVKKKQVIHHHHYEDGNKEENSDQAHATEMSLSLTSSSPSSENSDVFEDKKTSSGSDFTCLSHGVASVVGRRKEMEDAVRVELGFMGGPTGEDHAKTMRKKYDFFGVYDGHGGARVAEACKERLHELLVEVIAEDHHHHHQQQQEQQKHLYWDWESVMEGCFGKMDEEANRGSLREEMVGSTAVVAVVGNDELVVANCGDSRALLSRGGLAVPLSVDHKPDRPDELKRVEAAGGRVINWNGPRILGVLATSRSIGDQYLKPFVISKPEVTVTKRTEQDEFLILASDGLWDVVSNEVACQVVRRCFGGRIKWSSSFDDRNQADRAAAVLAELAIARGSSDNITVVVVELNKPTKFN